jgi:hypothetical protein
MAFVPFFVSGLSLSTGGADSAHVAGQLLRRQEPMRGYPLRDTPIPREERVPLRAG